ncbi:nucleotidyltransferase domain-containing protein [Butyrivibrio proteoclasticus]|uniref:nucleotidyltransferase domain-containing protein n=1 Tax=Butyrivibrio proteoclasticus TaxID=43305 RepID=UPI00047B835E|nr:nucleotidyltransferase domain-containing protein [Butyrivibrio proteoclasticus]
MLRDEILSTIPEMKKMISGNDVNDIPISSLRFGIAGSIALGKEKKNSDIDFVIDSDGFSLDTIDFIKNYLHDLFKRNVDILFLPLLRKEDMELDNIAKEFDLGINEDSVYKTVNREVIWFE